MGKAVPASRSPKGCTDEEFVQWIENYTPTHMYGHDRTRAYRLAGLPAVDFSPAMLISSGYTGKYWAYMIRANLAKRIARVLS